MMQKGEGTLKKQQNHILIGCVADDFTGASDAASFLAGQGIRTLLFNGIPKDTEVILDCAAVVIALKTRSIPAEDAVRDTLEALKWLDSHHTEQFYIKYCSTFDSTPKGNIGPDIDAALEQYGIPYTLLCPSLPVNKRIVKDGILIVDGRPVAEGHMAEHPLNPIWDSRIEKLMESQGKYPCMVLGEEILSKPVETVLAEVEAFGKDKEHFYIVPDYTTEEQGKKIVEIFGSNRLLTGGSGLLKHLADRCRERYDCFCEEEIRSWTPGKGIALCGSCSTASGRQCRDYEKKHSAVVLYPSGLLEKTCTVDEVWEQVAANPDEEYLIYSAGATDPKSRSYKSKEEAEKASAVLEKTMAELGRRAYNHGYTRIMVGGGETSGAVALALGFDGFIIGESIAPGVPVLVPLQDPEVRLALKSGNFGQDDFFEKALFMTKQEER